MEKFNEIENLWKQSENKISVKKIDVTTIKSNRMKLKKTQVKGAILLTITGFLVLIIMSILDDRLKTIPLIVSMIITSIVCFLQAGIMFFTAKKISDIDESQKPTLHLKQWINFKIYQKKLRHWNMPVYYALLGTALGIYMYELLKNVELWKMILAFVITYSWMFFAYFYLGKKELKKQDAQLDGIILELKNLENQFE